MWTIVWVLLSVSIAVAAEKKPPCFTPLSSCPLRGCGKEDSPDALSNTLKHRRPPQGEATTLTFDDFASLQSQAAERFDNHYSTLTKPDHARLRKLKAGSRTVGEGDLVEIVGYIAVLPEKSKPHANNSGESVNCRLSGKDNNDFHISLTQRPNGSEFDGIVVEMIPQHRPEEWTEEQLKKVQTAHKQVRVRGQLFFDNHHTVNSDPDHVLSNQPKRMSLWEVHPVTSFDVCTKQKCGEGDSGWQALEDF